MYMFDRETFQLMPPGTRTTLPLPLAYIGTLLYFDMDQVNEAHLEFTKDNYIAILSNTVDDAGTSFIRGAFLFTYHAFIYDTYNGETYYINMYKVHNTLPKNKVGCKRVIS